METKIILEDLQKLEKCSWDFERKEIILKAINKLREQNYSDFQIRTDFRRLLLKEQTNVQMIRNNERYLELLDQILNS